MKVSFVLPFFARRASGGVKVIYEYSNYLVGIKWSYIILMVTCCQIMQFQHHLSHS